MLSQPTPFPEVGSYALHIDGAVTRLARIQARETVGADHFALISYPARAGAGGNRTVPIGDLIDGTPLNAEETVELGAFADVRRAGKKWRKVRARFDELENRRIWARAFAAALRDAGLASLADASETKSRAGCRTCGGFGSVPVRKRFQAETTEQPCTDCAVV